MSKHNPRDEGLSSSFNRSDWLDRFDNSWYSGKRPCINQFLEEPRGAGLSVQDQRECLLLLVPIDMEYRWRLSIDEETTHNEDFASPVRSAGADSTITHDDPLPPRPRIEDYMQCYPLFESAIQVSVECIVEEIRIRHECHEDFEIEEYQSRFEKQYEAVAEWYNQQSAFQFDQNSTVIVSVYHQGNKQFQTPIDGSIQLGRQRLGEPDPVALVDGEDGKRLIVARLDERFFSRHHLTLTLQRRDILDVTNHSSKNSIRLPMLGSKISPGETKMLKLPIVMAIESKTIRVNHALGMAPAKPS